MNKKLIVLVSYLTLCLCLSVFAFAKSGCSAVFKKGAHTTVYILFENTTTNNATISFRYEKNTQNGWLIKEDSVNVLARNEQKYIAGNSNMWNCRSLEITNVTFY